MNHSNSRRCLVLAIASIVTGSHAFAEAPSPKEAYMSYRSALSSAQKIEDLQSMLSKKTNEEIAHTPPDMKPMMFQLMKGTSPSSVEVLSEKVDGDKATLQLSGKTESDPKIKEQTDGTVTLEKEDGAWKIAKEAWKSKIESGAQP